MPRKATSVPDTCATSAATTEITTVEMRPQRSSFPTCRPNATGRSCVIAAAPMFMNEFTVLMIAAATPEKTSAASSTGVKRSRNCGVASSARASGASVAARDQRLHRDAHAEVEQQRDDQRERHQQRIPLQPPRVLQHVELVHHVRLPQRADPEDEEERERRERRQLAPGSQQLRIRREHACARWPPMPPPDIEGEEEHEHRRQRHQRPLKQSV